MASELNLHLPRQILLATSIIWMGSPRHSSSLPLTLQKGFQGAAEEEELHLNLGTRRGPCSSLCFVATATIVKINNTENGTLSGVYKL